MARCDYCGQEVALPYRCKFCGRIFCVKHHLPENHDCPGLREYKARRHESIIYVPGGVRAYPSPRGEIPSRVVKVRASRPKSPRRGWRKGIVIALALLLIIMLCPIFDLDYDGLNNLEEIMAGTNPLSSDTDHDNISDKAELEQYHTNPLSPDSDEDDLVDSMELMLGTDPLNRDTDGDELWDGEEVNKYYTDPLSADTDQDGLTDGEEILYYQTDPREKDTDKDYLPDGYEVKIGTNPRYDWRHFYNEEAFKAGLCILFRREIQYISRQFLIYDTVLDRAWAVLKWISENIEYDHVKAQLDSSKLYAINETVYYKKGICSDYALLTAALLLDSGVSPVYMLDISFKNKETSHAAVAIKIHNEYFVLDQHLPLIPIGNYYWELLEDGDEILNVTFYAIRLGEDNEPEIVHIWTWSGDALKKRTYHITEEDIRLIVRLTKQRFLELYPHYREDLRLKQLAERHMKSIKQFNEVSKVALPPAFTRGWVLWWHDKHFVLYYHPVIAEKLVEEYWPGPAFLAYEWKNVINQCDKFYLIIDLDENNRIVLRDSSGAVFTIPRIIIVIEIAT
ncbi:MAG: calcium-binding protein [Thermoprotei archaeon]|nr:MAG: calcium-binding protein [Thermoprotei archaeon]